MKLSSVDFHTQAFNVINTLLDGAKEHGMDISTMPPSLSVISSKETLCDQGHEALEVYSSFPAILADVDEDSWSWIARTQMEEEPHSEGFVFFCVVNNFGSDFLYCFSYKKGGEYKAFLSDLDLLDLQWVDPFDVVPCLVDDYEIEITVH